MAAETRVQMRTVDGDGGEFWMEMDLDVTGQQERLQRFRIVNHRTTYPVNYFLKTPGGGIAIDSSAGDPNWPPVPAGQTTQFPLDGSTFNVRIDNRTDWQTGLG